VTNPLAARANVLVVPVKLEVGGTTKDATLVFLEMSEQQMATTADPMSIAPYRVLVFDDDEAIADLVRVMLERSLGCIVRTYNNPSTAETAVREFLPDVVFTDIEMPGMSGLDLIERVRAIMPGLPVVVMTAHISAAYAIKALQNQANDFITKPFVRADLTAAVLKFGAQWRSTLDFENEQQRAIEVQRSLLPAASLSLDGFALEGGCLPARAVGGDFFDWYPVGEEAAITLADVMGKGIGAAIIAATVRAVMRSHEDAGNLGHLLSRVDTVLIADLEKSDAFVTMFHGLLDPATATMRYVDAGHGLTILVRAAGGFKRLSTTSLPLGSNFGGGWREHIVVFEPGDMLVSVSDGVLDLFDGTLESMVLVDAIVRKAGSAKEVVDVLLEKARLSDAPDDVTVVAVQCVGG
jgi:CheY-like chemotaxis protein